MVPILDISNLLSICNKDDKLMRCFRIFLKQSLGKTFTVLPSTKNLVIHTETSQLICFKNQLVGLYMTIFSMNLWCATHNHAINLRSFSKSILLFILSGSLKNLGGPFYTANNHIYLAVFFFLYSKFPVSKFWKHLIRCVSDFTMSTIGWKSRKLHLLIVRKCNHGK